MGVDLGDYTLIIIELGWGTPVKKGSFIDKCRGEELTTFWNFEFSTRMWISRNSIWGTLIKGWGRGAAEMNLMGWVNSGIQITYYTIINQIQLRVHLLRG